MLVGIMSAVLFCVMYLVAPVHFMDRDLIVIPCMLLIYGLSCVPQAYLFSLGQSAPLNTMTFIIINIVFGEATVISQIFYGDVYNYAERLLSLSPQYNVAHAFIRMTQIFVYNSECVLFNNRDLCSSNMLHRCCQKCGIMEPCFERISYLSRMGILDEVIATLISGVLFISLLAVWEYKIVQRFTSRFLARWVYRTQSVPVGAEGATRDLRDVKAKVLEMKLKRTIGIKKDTYGEHLLVHNLTRRDSGRYILRNISFGIGKGQALAVVGLKRHGRLRLCEILAGYRLPSDGNAYTISKWNLFTKPVNYARNVSLCCFENTPLPPWMTVFDALVLIAVLRGVPRKHVKEEVQELIDALELHDRANMDVCRLHLNERTRLTFAAAGVGAPPVLVLDECTAYQKYSINRAMYYILYHLRKQGHAIFVSSARSVAV
ncbi:uncharacterized protein [Choristoneura fumiferana]|uniref:uncharacterized protein n=1 Tax=Choristoneura fumiferana TaxID=7141 RepID=UPI003D155E73